MDHFRKSLDPVEEICMRQRNRQAQRSAALVIGHRVLASLSQRNWASVEEFGKFPRASSSSAGRLRQVAADRARAGEKFLMAHFPASLSMNRLAGSSGTQKVCEATKSKNRTGSVISKSGRSRLSQTAATMTQRGLKHQAERRQLKVSGGVPRGRRCPKPCCCYVSCRARPPAHATAPRPPDVRAVSPL